MAAAWEKASESFPISIVRTNTRRLFGSIGFAPKGEPIGHKVLDRMCVRIATTASLAKGCEAEHVQNGIESSSRATTVLPAINDQNRQEKFRSRQQSNSQPVTGFGVTESVAATGIEPPERFSDTDFGTPTAGNACVFESTRSWTNDSSSDASSATSISFRAG